MGRLSALARRKARRGEWAYEVWRERLRPSASISGLMSEMVMVDEGEWFMLVA